MSSKKIMFPLLYDNTTNPHNNQDTEIICFIENPEELYTTGNINDFVKTHECKKLDLRFLVEEKISREGRVYTLSIIPHIVMQDGKSYDAKKREFNSACVKKKTNPFQKYLIYPNTYDKGVDIEKDKEAAAMVVSNISEITGGVENIVGVIKLIQPKSIREIHPEYIDILKEYSVDFERTSHLPPRRKVL